VVVDVHINSCENGAELLKRNGVTKVNVEAYLGLGGSTIILGTFILMLITSHYTEIKFNFRIACFRFSSMSYRS